MKPVRTAQSDVVYRGPTPDVGDLWCHRIKRGQISVTYELDDEERAVVLAGGRIELVLWSEPIPPISIGVVDGESSAPVAEHPFKVPTDTTAMKAGLEAWRNIRREPDTLG